MNLVVGATGILGSEICRELARNGKPVRALVRATSDPSKVEGLSTTGAEVVYGDLKDRTSLDKACRGVGSIISTASCTFSRQQGDSIETVDHRGQMSLVDAAQAAGINRFVFVSFRDHLDVKFPLSMAKRAVEKRLKASGMIYTFLHCSWFMEVWLSPALGFDYPNGSATVFGTGQNKISWVSYKDVARIAVAALDNTAAENEIINVGGPEPLSPTEVVKVFEGMAGKKYAVEHVPVSTLREQKAGAQDPLQESFAALQLWYSMGDEVDMIATQKMFGLELATVRDYAESVMTGS